MNLLAYFIKGNYDVELKFIYRLDLNVPYCLDLDNSQDLK